MSRSRTPGSTGGRRTRLLRCVRCGEEKPLSAFPKDKSRSNGVFPYCRPCHVLTQGEYRRKRVLGAPAVEGQRACPVCLKSLEGQHANRIYCSPLCKSRAKSYESYGLTPEDVRVLKKGGRCPICGRKVRRWAIDHNHQTGETTGIVCLRCNVSLLAYTYHDPEIAEALWRYLKTPPASLLGGDQPRYAGPPSTSQLHRMWGWAGEHGGT